MLKLIAKLSKFFAALLITREKIFHIRMHINIYIYIYMHMNLYVGSKNPPAEAGGLHDTIRYAYI